MTPLPRCVDGHCADGALLIGPPGVVLVLQPVQPLHEPLVRDEVGLEGRRRAIGSKCLVIVRLIETEIPSAFGWLIIPILNYVTRSRREVPLYCDKNLNKEETAKEISHGHREILTVT